MDREWQVTDPEELGVIMNIVHDCWFDVEDVSFDAGVGKLSVTFQRPSIGEEGGLFKKQGPLSDWVLEIEGVESYELAESENVGRYDFNENRLLSRREAHHDYDRHPAGILCRGQVIGCSGSAGDGLTGCTKPVFT